MFWRFRGAFAALSLALRLSGKLFVYNNIGITHHRIFKNYGKTVLRGSYDRSKFIIIAWPSPMTEQLIGCWIAGFPCRLCWHQLGRSLGRASKLGINGILAR